MSSKQSNGIGTTILVILIIAVAIGGIGAGVYFTGISPEFTAIVDTYLGRNSVQKTVASTESVDKVEEISDIVQKESVVDEPVVTDPEPVVVVPDVEKVSLIDLYLMPDDSARRLMLAGFKNWAGMDTADIPELSFFYPRNSEGSWTYPVVDYSSRLIPFIPDEQGMYSIGLAQDSGSWISALAFVAVFEENGELLSVSVDYHADRPQVSLHLRDDRMYYIAQGFFTDENPIPEHTVLRVQEAL